MTTTEGTQRSPVAKLLADRNFRRYWIAQTLVFGTNGTVRFAFVWLVVTLTDWPSAEGLIGISLGLPALFLALPAGAWSDRTDRRCRLRCPESSRRTMAAVRWRQGCFSACSESGC